MAAADDADSQSRLAVYGSLAPGQSNHHQLAGLEGRWLTGYVHGSLYYAERGATMGYPAITLDPGGPEVDVEIFESADLPAHWARLDDFEGPGYQRVVTTVHTSNGDLTAQIYALVREP